MRKVMLVATWVVALSITVVLMFLAYDAGRPAPTPEPFVIEREPRRQAHNRRSRWTVTEYLSAHRVLVAHVETDYLHEAMSIAQQIADPIKTRYAEVLIYFHRPGRPDTLPPRKVQWTAKTGYVATVYE